MRALQRIVRPDLPLRVCFHFGGTPFPVTPTSYLGHVDTENSQKNDRGRYDCGEKHSLYCTCIMYSGVAAVQESYWNPFVTPEGER